MTDDQKTVYLKLSGWKFVEINSEMLSTNHPYRKHGGYWFKSKDLPTFIEVSNLYGYQLYGIIGGKGIDE